MSGSLTSPTLKTSGFYAFQINKDDSEEVPSVEALEALAKKVEGDWEQEETGFFSQREVVPGVTRVQPLPHGEDQRCLQSVRNADQVDWSQWEDHFITKARKQRPSFWNSWDSGGEVVLINAEPVSIEGQWNTPGFEDWQFTQGSELPTEWPQEDESSSSQDYV